MTVETYCRTLYSHSRDSTTESPPFQLNDKMSYSPLAPCRQVSPDGSVRRGATRLYACVRRGAVRVLVPKLPSFLSQHTVDHLLVRLSLSDGSPMHVPRKARCDFPTRCKQGVGSGSFTSEFDDSYRLDQSKNQIQASCLVH